MVLEKSRNLEEEPHGQGHRSCQGNSIELENFDERGQTEI
jgi:hypothetical protein